MIGKNNPLLAHIKKLNTSRAYRYQCGQFAAEGEKLLREALLSGAEIECVVAEEEPDYIDEGIRVETASPQIIRSISDVQTPQGTVFVCSMPKNPPQPDRGRFLILDGVQDPGNVGTVLRTAEAFEIDAVILTGDCADPYNPKVIRGSMGAVFRQSFFIMDRKAVAESFKARSIPLYAAAGGGEGTILDVDTDNCGFIIGNEGAGVSPELLNCADLRVRIPMGGRCESLNAAVAASIIMWEIYKKG